MSRVSLNDDRIAPCASRFPKRWRRKASARPLKGLHSRSSFFAREESRGRGGDVFWKRSRDTSTENLIPQTILLSSLPPSRFNTFESPLVGYVGTENYIPHLDRNKIWRIHPVLSTCNRTRVLAHDVFLTADNCLTSDCDSIKDLFKYTNALDSAGSTRGPEGEVWGSDDSRFEKSGNFENLECWNL